METQKINTKKQILRKQIREKKRSSGSGVLPLGR